METYDVASRTKERITEFINNLVSCNFPFTFTYKEEGWGYFVFPEGFKKTGNTLFNEMMQKYVMNPYQYDDEIL